LPPPRPEEDAAPLCEKDAKAPLLCKVRFAKYLSMSVYFYVGNGDVFYFEKEEKKRKPTPFFLPRETLLAS